MPLLILETTYYDHYRAAHEMVGCTCDREDLTDINVEHVEFETVPEALEYINGNVESWRIEFDAYTASLWPDVPAHVPLKTLSWKV